MNLLLTSGGITNKPIASELKRLVKGEIRIAFIPTAANIQDEPKDWLVKNLAQCLELGRLDIVDISALKKENWLPRLQKANVIVMGGGYTYYLMDWVRKSGLSQVLPELLKDRVYVGISAGSMIVSKFDYLVVSESLYGEPSPSDVKCLGYVNFNILPHLGSPYFKNLTDKRIKEVAQQMEGDIYALDDQSAVLYTDGKIKVISEGIWKKY